MRRTAENAGATAVTLLTENQEVLVWGGQATPASLHSAVKVVLSALVAVNIGDGPDQVRLEATVAELGLAGLTQNLVVHALVLR